MLKLGEYLNYSDEQVVNDIVTSYEVDINLVNKYDILIAELEYGSYEGSSFFLLREKETGKLYENHGGHCSCYGFEGQFEPKESSLTYLKSAHFPYNNIEEVKAFIETLE